MARLKLLGAVVCEEDGERLDGLSARQHPIAILALLARASSRTISRGKLVGHLWPETPEQTARSRLSTHVHEIRRALGEEILLSEGDDLRLNRDALSCDVWKFAEALHAEAWDRAVALYRGPLLDGFRLKRSPAFEKWLDGERAELRRAYHRALEALAEEAAERAEPVAAARWWRRRAEDDPYDSRVVVQLMDALVAAGNPAEALRVARVHGRLLAEELGTEPSPEVRVRAERIEAGAADSGPREVAETVTTGSPGESAAAADRAPARPTGARHEEAPTAGKRDDPEPKDPGAPDLLARLGRLSAVVILLLAAVVAVWYLTTGGRERPETGERTVAVLPFQVSGSGTDTWRNGMVSLLSANLDGAAGLRTIADRTVFAAVNERGYEAEAISTEQALDVARQVGARYAVVGSASQLGDELQLTARLYETHSENRLNQVQVSGPAKGVTLLADSLTREMLAVLLADSGEDIPSVDLASITTRSLPALKRYLAGERHLRAGEYAAAIEDYEAAVESDSTFALAYLRLGRANGWALNREAARRNLDRAYRLSDQMPERERGTARAQYLFYVENRNRAAADSLRRLTDAYPDGPVLWYVLGEVLWHSAIPRGWPEADRAFERAIELDPGHALYHPHHAQLGIAVHHDSALAAERIASMPREDWRETYRIPLELAFGTPTARREALGRVDTIPLSDPGLWHALRHPAERDALDTLLRRLRGRQGIQDVYGENPLWGPFVFNSFLQGQVQEGLSRLEAGTMDPDLESCLMAYSRSVGIPVPDSVTAAYLEPSSLSEDPSRHRLRCASIYLIDQGREDEVDALIAGLPETAGVGEGDTVPPGVQASIDEALGYLAWRTGELEEAVRRFSGRMPADILFQTGALWRGDLNRQLGRLRTAEGWYLAGWTHPVAHERLGQLYEEMGAPEKAAAAYRRFVAAWENADEELQGRVEAARKQLRELTGSDPETDE